MIRLTTGRAALFGAILAAALVALLPLRLVLGGVGLGDQGLAARRVDGVLWGGRLIEARFGAVALGDLDARLSFWPLFVGRARVALAGEGVQPVRGAVTIERHAIGVDGMTASLATGQLFAPLPVTALDLDDVDVRFRDGRCDRAAGRARATRAGEAGGVPLPPTLSGPAACDGGALVLALASQAGTETATLRIGGDGRYHVDFALRTGDPVVAARLERAGFVGGPQGYRLTVEGRF